jgi:hypothetical protein
MGMNPAVWIALLAVFMGAGLMMFIAISGAKKGKK